MGERGGCCQDGGDRVHPLLVQEQAEALEEGGGVRTPPEDQVHPEGLRRRHPAGQGGAGRRHRLPPRQPLVLRGDRLRQHRGDHGHHPRPQARPEGQAREPRGRELHMQALQQRDQDVQEDRGGGHRVRPGHQGQERGRDVLRAGRPDLPHHGRRGEDGMGVPMDKVYKELWERSQ